MTSDISPTDVKIKYGTTLWNDPSVEWQDVDELIQHEKYGLPPDRKYDIGLIKLKKDIVYNDKVQPINLPIRDNIDSQFTVVFTGWRENHVSRKL